MNINMGYLIRIFGITTTLLVAASLVQSMSMEKPIRPDKFQSVQQLDDYVQKVKEYYSQLSYSRYRKRNYMELMNLRPQEFPYVWREFRNKYENEYE